jgi:hypothetical protein
MRAALANRLPPEILQAWKQTGQVPRGAKKNLLFWVTYLLHCVLCVSVWAGMALALLWYFGGVVGQIVNVGLAASGGAVVLGSALANMGR